MEKRCPTCNEFYRIDDSKIRPGIRFRCKKCKGLIQISENDIGTNRGTPEITKSVAELSFQMNRTPQSTTGKAINSDKNVQTDATIGLNYQFQENTPDITSKQKIIRTLIILVLIITIHIQPLRSIVFGNALFKKADSVAEKWVNDSIKRALIAYGSARSLNAVISVVKGSTGKDRENFFGQF